MGIVSKMYNWQPQPGDPIEIPRRLYSHWAIYVGDGNVVHLTLADGWFGNFFFGVPSPDTKKVVVKKEPLSKVGTYHVNYKYDQQYQRRPVEEILQLADALVGKRVDYDLLGNNCEHFVTWLCYRVPRSEQAEDIEGALQRAAQRWLEEPKPGDSIEIPRGLYSHWAVYVGNGNVVHLTGADGRNGSFFFGDPSPNTQKVVVKEEPLSEMGTYHVNEKVNQQYQRRPVAETLRIAKFLVGKEMDYDLFQNNCENFVTWLRHTVP